MSPKVIPPWQDAPLCSFCHKPAVRVYYGPHGTYRACRSWSHKRAGKKAAG